MVRETWRDWAEQFWIGLADDEKEVKIPELHRTKVWHWLVLTWSQLVVATGFGWTQFQQPMDREERGPPLQWPTVTVSIDQGGDGWSACQFLLSQCICLILLCDTSHRTWNDYQLALHDSGYWYWCICMIVLLNYDNGPWQSQQWYLDCEGDAKHCCASPSTLALFGKAFG